MNTEIVVQVNSGSTLKKLITFCSKDYLSKY